MYKKMAGYLHSLYAESLAEFGTPREMPQCKGWLLKRQIPDTPDVDVMGCYPLFNCRNWDHLIVDLDSLEDEVVSISIVTDPFGEYTVKYLHTGFKDLVIPFKQHFITDLNYPMNTFICQHHRRYARKSLQILFIEKCEPPSNFLEDWINLYTVLIARHRIKGIPAFSRFSFAKQFDVPGLVVFRATYKQTTVGMLLWYVQGEVAYYHLGAYSDKGYTLKASFALFWFAIKYFIAQGLQWLNLGAGVGTSNDGSDGLSRFKRGWSTGTRPVYFCGRIFDRAKYAELVQAKGIMATTYFPAYRKGEFSS